MSKCMFRGDALEAAQVTRLEPPTVSGEISLTITGSNKFITLAAWDAGDIAEAWNACLYPEFKEATASVDGEDVLLTSTLAGRPFYVSATVNGEGFANEVQYIIPVNNVTGDTITASWNGETTAIFDPTDTDGDELQDLFEAFASLAVGDVIVTGDVGGPWRVEFTGKYAGQDVPLITIDKTNLTGGTAAQNEIQRLSLSGASTEVTFALQRPDTEDITIDLTTPITAAELEAAIESLGYEVTCTGGDLTSGGPSPINGTLTHDGYYSEDEAIFSETRSVIGRRFDGSFYRYENTLLRFTLPVDQGATILNAAVSLRSFAGGTIHGTIRAHASDDAAWPASAAAAHGAALGSEAVPFIFIAGGWDTIDITPIIQQVVDRVGFVKNNHIVLQLLNDGTSTYGEFFTSEAPPAGTYSPTLQVTTDDDATSTPIDIEWVGGDAATDIPQLVVVGSTYIPAPLVSTIQNGRPAVDPDIEVEVLVAGGDQIRIRDDVRSRGPNHWDDPINWITEEGDLGVPGRLDKVFIESNRVDLMYGLGQRLGFVAQPLTNQLRLVTGRAIFWNGQKVEVRTSAADLPAGLAINTTYYVINVDGPYLQLSLTEDGPAVDITDAGTGTHLIGVNFEKIEIESRYTGKHGLPRRNTGGDYWEYRERSLACWLVAPTGTKPNIRIGQGTGGGSSRIMLETGVGSIYLQLVASSGSVESGVPAVQWRGTRADGQLIKVEILGGEFGTAIFPEESSIIDQLIQRSGSMLLGRDVTIYDIDATGGSRVSLGATIEGVAVMT